MTARERLRLASLLPASLLLTNLPLYGAAWAAAPAACMVAEHQLDHIFRLPQVARAIAAKKLDVLVVGSASSTLPGAHGAENAYPVRLQMALVEAWPGVAVKVATDVTPHRTAADMVKTLQAVLVAAKPALVIWQTGTVDAMQAVDTDQFNDALEKGIAMIRSAGADVIMVNSQYSPRTESMIALGSYDEDMRRVALQHEVPLFDRFEIMKLWADLGTFDFTDAPDKLAMAGRVHDCIGRLLADLVNEAAKPSSPPAVGVR